MGSLFTSLLNSTGAMTVYSQALQVVTNNVSNANTPGYVKQTANLSALPFDLATGLPGGVAFGPVVSSRDQYLENNVRQQQSALGSAQQEVSDLSNLQGIFDLSAQSGVSAGLNNLFQSFSQLSVSPNDSTARQNVLTQAGQLAQSFNNAASAITTTSNQVSGETQSTIDTINQLASNLAQINASHPKDSQGNVNAGVDAQLNSTLEQLSQYTNYLAVPQTDGTVNVYIGGRSPLVVGDASDPIQGSFSNQKMTILDGTGQDITSSVTGGQLAGLVDVQNNKLPSYQAGLDTLAQSVADQVNTALSKGVDANGNAPTANLFTYNSAAGAAQTLAVNPALTPDQIAAALPGAPGGNGNALNLAGLANANLVDGQTFSQYFGSVGGQVGQDISSAQAATDTATQLLTQAQSTRSQDTGVSLDEQATQMIQYQRSYEAAAKLISVLDELTSVAVNIITPASS